MLYKLTCRKIYNDYSSEGTEIHSDSFRDDTLLKAGLKLNHLRMIVTDLGRAGTSNATIPRGSGMKPTLTR